MSRRQLAARTGLQSSTVTYIVRDLTEQGIIRAVGKLPKAGAGKRQVLLEINPELGWVAGVGLEGDWASLVFLDAAGGVIDRDRFALREPADLLPWAIRTRVDNWVTRHGRPAGKLLGVGVGVPGIVDPGQGMVLRSTRFKAQDWPLAKLMQQVFESPVEIDNDSNFAALAEARLGSAAGVSNFLYFLMNVSEEGKAYAVHGLGSSLFLDGKLYRGSHYSAGEIDTLIEKAPYGTVAAEHLLLIARPEGELPRELEPVLERIVDTLVAVVDLVDPAVVVLGGNLCVSNRRMLRFIEEEMNRRVVRVPGRQVAVRSSAFIDYGVSMGAAVAALDAALHAGSDEAFPAEAFPAILNAQPYPPG